MKYVGDVLQTKGEAWGLDVRVKELEAEKQSAQAHACEPGAGEPGDQSGFKNPNAFRAPGCGTLSGAHP